MEAVRTRAGVGKATIYRRWSSKEELVRDAIVFLHEEFDDARHRQPARRLRGAGRRGAGERVARRRRTLMPRLLGEAVNDPELFAIFRAHLVEPRRAALRHGARARDRARRDPRRRRPRADDRPVRRPAVYRLLITGGDIRRCSRSRTQMDALMNGLAAAGLEPLGDVAHLGERRRRGRGSARRSARASRSGGRGRSPAGASSRRARRRRRARPSSRARRSRSRAPCSAPTARPATGRS